MMTAAHSAGERGTLYAVAAAGERVWENRWDFWVFPEPPAELPTGVVRAETLDAKLVKFAAAGGAVLVVGGFPGETSRETFRPHTSGRALGHAGAIIHRHPVWRRFPHAGFADWQFFPMMRECRSLVNDAAMPEFAPLLELIASFKLIRRKSLLSEFSVGCGRIIFFGLKLDAVDPAARWLCGELLSYLGGREYAPAPDWPQEALLARLDGAPSPARIERAVDAGGRPEQ